jgi:raffinose/stachyose/melibiose transport system substrate-binding protein
MNKRFVSVMMASAMSVTMLAGCGSGSGDESNNATSAYSVEKEASSASTTENTAQDNSEERTLRFYHWRTEDKAAYEKLAENYEKMNPGLSIEIEIVPSADYISTWLVKANGGELDDVFGVQPDGTFEQLIKSGQLMTFDDCDDILSAYNEDALGAGTRDGHIYAVPQTNALAMYYNKTIFDEYGLDVPTTEDEFLKVCKTLKDNGVTPIAEGCGVNWIAEFMIEGMLANSCDDLSVFGTGELTSDPGVLDTVKFAKQLYDNGYIMEGSSGISEESMLTGFAVGNYAMISTGTWSMSTIRDINPDCDFGLFNIPGSKGTTKGVSNTGLMLGINKDSKLIDDAKGFVKYLTSKDAMDYLCNETGQLTVVNGVDISDDDLKMAQSLLSGPDGIVSAPFHQANTEGLTVCFNRTTQLMIESVDDPEQFVKDWEAELKKTLE